MWACRTNGAGLGGWKWGGRIVAWDCFDYCLVLVDSLESSTQCFVVLFATTRAELVNSAAILSFQLAKSASITFRSQPRRASLASAPKPRTSPHTPSLTYNTSPASTTSLAALASSSLLSSAPLTLQAVPQARTPPSLSQTSFSLQYVVG